MSGKWGENVKVFCFSFKWLYRSIFDDCDFGFLLTMAIFVGLVWGCRINEFYFIESSSIFIASGAIIAALLSFLAIESNRAIKEKEEERKDIDALGGHFVDIVVGVSETKVAAKKVLGILGKIDANEKRLVRLRKEYEDVVKEIDGLKAGYFKKAKELEGRENRKEDILNRGAKLNEARSQMEEAAEEFLENYMEKTRIVVRANNKARLYYLRIENNHALDDIEARFLHDFAGGFIKKFQSAKADFQNGVAARLGDGHFSKSQQEEYSRKSFESYGFPDEVNVYEKLGEFFKNPGLHVEKKSKRYQVVQNRCFSSSVVFFLIGVINGFSLL